MTDTEMIQDTANRQQYTNQPQPQNSFRPNVNPNLTGVRPQAPQISGQNVNLPTGQQLQQQQQQHQRPLAPPLRRIDSKQNIPPQPPGSQQRPVGPPINQQFRPQPGTQPIQQHQRPQPPQNWQGNPTGGPGHPIPQQNRPPFQPHLNQQQNPQVRQQFQRPPGQYPVTAPGQAPYRPPFPQQQQQQQQQLQQQHQQLQQQHQQLQQQQQIRTSSPTIKTLPKQGSSQSFNMSSEVAKPLSNSSLINSMDDDDDVIIGRATTPLKVMKPVDPMTQSQYGSLDNSARHDSQNEVKKLERVSSQDKMKPKSGSDETQAFKTQERRSNIHENSIKSEQSAPPSNYERQNPQRPLTKPSVPLNVINKNEEKDYNRQKESLKSVDNRNVPSVVSSKPPIVPQTNMNVDTVQKAPPRTMVNPRNETQNRVEMNRKPFLDVDSRSQRSHNKSLKGDNDSGVDESTQGNERNGPGSPGSPLKSPTKISGTSRPPSATPSSKSNKSRSASRSRILKTPDPEPIKKVPMNKIQVGNAPSPNLKAVKSKIGSLENTSYKPGGGNVKIETKKIEIKAAPRIEAKNERYTPKGGEKKIISTKLQWNAKSKIGSLENAHHKPGGGDKKIETIKTEFKEKAKPKVGSKENVKHVPRGGDIKIQTHKIEIKAESKIGSMDNVKHKPGGGDKKIFDDKDYLKNVEHPVAPTPPSQSPIPSSMTSSSVADENLNQQQS